MTWTNHPGTGAVTRLCVSLALAGLGAGCGGSPPGEGVDGPIDMLPADAAMAVVVEDLAALSLRLDVDEIRARRPALVARGSTAIRNAVGFDLLDPDSARAQGLDPSRPLAFAILAEPPGATVLVLPGEETALLDRLDGVYRRRGASPTVAETHAGVDVHVADRAAAAYLPLAGHVLVVSGIQRPDLRLATCRRLIDDAGTRALASDAAFRRVHERIPGERDLYGYFAPTPADSAGRESVVDPSALLGPDLAPLLAFSRAGGPHEGAALSGHVARDRLTLASYTALEDPAATLTAVPLTRRTPDPFIENLASQPLFVVQLNLDPRAALERLDELTPGAAVDTADGTPLAGRRRAFVESVTGRVGILASKIGIFGTDIVAYAQGRPGGELEALLDSVVVELRRDPVEIPMLGSTRGIERDREGDVPFYRLQLLPFADLCAGVVSDHLVVTTTRERMAAIIAGRGGFLQLLPGGEVRDALREGHVTAAYVDVAGFSEAMGMLPIPQVEEYAGVMRVIQMFEHVTAVGDIDDEGYATRIQIVAGEPGVWPRLVEALLSARGRAS